VSLATVERLGRLAQTAREAVVDQRDLEHALERVENRHAAAAAGVCVDFDFVVVGRDFLAADFLGWLFYIRLQRVLVRGLRNVGKGDGGVLSAGLSWSRMRFRRH